MFFRIGCLTLCFGGWVMGQGPQPLGPPPVPPANPITAEKAQLGKALFWDEQLSSTGTVACGTCHKPRSGGADSRPLGGTVATTHPGGDGIYGNGDDVFGSPGVPLTIADGTYLRSSTFGLYEQVTGRKAPSSLNSAYSPVLFWDGRALGQFSDPVTGNVLISQGGALESQILGPPVSSAEMAHVGRDWNQVASKIEASRPLALADDIPTELALWMGERDYPTLFQEAFGTPDVTPARIALAIATYERTLVADQTPFDDDLAGNPQALTQQERRGRNVFMQNGCNQCHAGPLLTDNQFHYIGVRPHEDDLGRFNVTGNPQDRGRFRTPGLRNVAQRAPYFHTGRFQTLMDVIDFYDRGGDFNAPNKDPRIHPLNLSNGQKSDLLAFLTRPLSDPRVVDELSPFDRPTLFSESDRVPVISGLGVSGSGGFTPVPMAIEPPLLGNLSFTIGVDEVLGNASAYLVVDEHDPGTSGLPLSASFAFESLTTQGAGAGQGYASVSLVIPNGIDWLDVPLYARWYIVDPASAGGYAVSQLIQFTPFGQLPACVVDLDGNGVSDMLDMVSLINQFGPCVSCSGDLNHDQIVDQNDLLMLCELWLTSCP